MAEIIEFKDRDGFKGWLPQKHAQLPASALHVTSPLVTVHYQNAEHFLGGWDDTKDLAQKIFSGKAKRHDLFPAKILADVDIDGATYDYDLVVIG